MPCYVLVSEGRALIIDTGVAAHWGRIRDGLDAVLTGIPDRAPDHDPARTPTLSANLPAIVQRYALRSVYCGGVISPLDFFERVDSTSTEGHIRSIAKSDVSWLTPGSLLQVGRMQVETFVNHVPRAAKEPFL